MNLLRVYLAKNRITVKAFAEKLELSEGYMRDIYTGRKRPSKKVANWIERGTNGVIKSDDLLNGIY